MSILLCGCTTWTLTKCIEKKFDGNYTRMLCAMLNKSWRQHSTKQQLYGYLPSMRKTIEVSRSRHTGHYWRSKDELISDILLWAHSHGRTKAGWPARTYIYNSSVLIQDIALKTSWEQWPIDWWQERVREIPAGSTMLWW